MKMDLKQHHHFSSDHIFWPWAICDSSLFNPWVKMQVLPMFSTSFPPTQWKGSGSACRLPALVLNEMESSELSLTDAFVYPVNIYHVLSYVSGTALRLAPGWFQTQENLAYLNKLGENQIWLTEKSPSGRTAGRRKLIYSCQVFER